MDPLVSTEWLQAALGTPDLRVIDASFFLSSDGRDARAEFEAAHIPGAAFVDLDDVSDPDSPFPHMLPSETRFASRMRALGIGDATRIVVYDNSPLRSAARLWWMLRLFGARDVALLDGGFQKWRAEKRPTHAGTAGAGTAGHFTARLCAEGVADKAAMLATIESGNAQIVDARSAARFSGRQPEPRPGLASGHIPGARNLPQGDLFNADNSWKRGETLRAEFETAGINLARPMITTCGSGVTAAVVLFGARLLGHEDVRLYDGSWSEWGADPATPKASLLA